MRGRPVRSRPGPGPAEPGSVLTEPERRPERPAGPSALGHGRQCVLHVGDQREPEPPRHAGLGQRLPAAQLHQDRAALLRCCLLPVHGHAVPGLRPPAQGEVPGQAGARVHPQLQGAAGRLQEDGGGQDHRGGAAGERQVPGQLRVHPVVQEVLRRQLRREGVQPAAGAAGPGRRAPPKPSPPEDLADGPQEHAEPGPPQQRPQQRPAEKLPRRPQRRPRRRRADPGAQPAAAGPEADGGRAGEGAGLLLQQAAGHRADLPGARAREQPHHHGHRQRPLRHGGGLRPAGGRRAGGAAAGGPGRVLAAAPSRPAPRPRHRHWRF